MNKQILKIFSNVLNEIGQGKIEIKQKYGKRILLQKMFYKISHENKIYTNACEEEIPCLEITNLPNFINLLEKSITARRRYHYFDMPNFLNNAEYLKYLIVVTFTNMTSYDFSNPEKYLEDKITAYDKRNILFDCTLNELGEIELNGESYNLCLEVANNHATLESLFSFTYILENDNGGYCFPTVLAEKIDDKLVVRAIQKKGTYMNEKVEEKVANYIKRNFPKGPNNKNISYLRNVNPVFVLALNTFINHVQNYTEGAIKTVEFPLYTPIRYNNYIAGLKEDTLSTKEFERGLEKINKQQDHITNKFLYTALRMQYHMPYYEILDYGDDSSMLKLKINEHIKQDDIFDKFAHPTKKLTY